MSGTIYHYSHKGNQVEIGKLGSGGYMVLALEGNKGGAVVMPMAQAMLMAQAILDSDPWHAPKTKPATDYRAQFERAERALLRAGFTDNGAQEWEPPIGRAPDFISRMPPPTRPAPPMPKVKPPRAETVDEAAERSHEQNMEAVRHATLGHCMLPPLGWVCTRGSGHPGPCAAVEDEDFREVVDLTTPRAAGYVPPRPMPHPRQPPPPPPPPATRNLVEPPLPSWVKQFLRTVFAMMLLGAVAAGMGWLP